MAKSRGAAGLRNVDTTPSTGERVTYRFDADLDQELGLTEAVKQGPEALRKCLSEAPARGFVLTGSILTEHHRLVAITRAPGG